MSSQPALHDARTTARTLAPLITMGAAFGARKVMVKGYESRTGRPAPLVRSANGTIVEKILWAATMAAVLALIEAIVWKVIGEDED
ncbi:MAG TPA: DUF4235 domain-containing protein [Candidatus Nanopelagicales bacterium]